MNTSATALLALRAFRSSASLSNPKTSSTWVVSRSFAAAPTAKSGGTSGGANVDSKNLDPPSNIFKQVDKSALGPGASKQSDYKNPEYFSYHNMSYSEMEIVMAKHRIPQPSNNKTN